MWTTIYYCAVQLQLFFCTFMYIMYQFQNYILIISLTYYDTFSTTVSGNNLQQQQKKFLSSSCNLWSWIVFFSFNFTIFFGLVLKADWIFLFRAQMIRILLWTLKCYDIKITKKKKKKKENTKWKKKIKTRILTRQTFEYFTQRNESCMYHSDPLAKKWNVHVCSLRLNFTNFYFKRCILKSNSDIWFSITEKKQSCLVDIKHLSVTIVTKHMIITCLLLNNGIPTYNTIQLIRILLSVNCLKAQPFEIMGK